MKLYYLIISTLILALLNLVSSLNTLYLEIFIDKDYNVSLVTYYFLDKIQEEKYEKTGNIEVRILDKKNNIIKTVFSNISKEDFIREGFSPIKGKLKIEVPFVIKSFSILLPENSSKIQVLVEKELKLELKIENKTIIIKENRYEPPFNESPKKDFSNILFIILLFLIFLGMLILILSKIKKLFS